MSENENSAVHKLSPVELVQGQLEAYNNHDIEKFCTFFSEDILVFDALTKQVLFEGMKVFRERYTQSFANPNLHCTLVNRMVQENIVIDQESVVGLGEDIVQAIAIYHIKNGIIKEVHFY